MRIPLVDLHPVTQECQIVVSVGEVFDSNCSGIITIMIINANGLGNNIIQSKEVGNLTHATKTVLFEETPKINGIFPVVATLVLESNESKSDQTEFIEFC
ncbi:hypothetical protein [Belliella aquatica]|uniref:Uncharacterized protein n=1 Tax=Belliella aquatica TaxID=1323734 RepID=A0ABQ1N4U3_9BACT|nr:hypothetical protein [Belliella aquatica]MCH7407404.1 hypothetical protein [Belliella aquatica]GGC53183.1 hypothetical protein GCM10010993_34550 [Belliella aquatica]